MLNAVLAAPAGLDEAALSPDGETIAFEANAFEARVQHELDRLNGVLFLDRIAAKQDLFRRRSSG
jgi:peptide deformylase